MLRLRLTALLPMAHSRRHEALGRALRTKISGEIAPYDCPTRTGVPSDRDARMALCIFGVTGRLRRCWTSLRLPHPAELLMPVII
jgi:hypothetical protein